MNFSDILALLMHYPKREGTTYAYTDLINVRVSFNGFRF